MKIIQILFIELLLLTSIDSLYAGENEKELWTVDRLSQQGGGFYQTHLGLTIALGTAYITSPYKHNDILNGPYAEASVGTYGYGSDFGWFWDKGSVSWGTSLSYVYINDIKSKFNRGNYYGFTIKGSYHILSVRAGAYHEKNLHDNKVSFSIGLGY